MGNRCLLTMADADIRRYGPPWTPWWRRGEIVINEGNQAHF